MKQETYTMIYVILACVVILAIVHSCNNTAIEIAKQKANTTRDINLGIGKK